MTLDNTELLTITESTLANGAALCTLAGQVAGASHPAIVVVAASPVEKSAMERRAAGLGAAGDVFQRANLVTLPAREHAQRFAGLLTMLGTDVRLLEPAEFSPITRGNALEAEPRLLHAKRYEQASGEARVLVLAGGVGRTRDGHLTSLGTGGATLSGLFVAQRLGIPVRLVVDDQSAASWSPVALPKRSSLFARKHGLSYGVVSRVDAAEAQPEAVSA